MIAGVPGVGISGIFYLLCAFIMPIKEFINRFKGTSTSRRRKMARRQFGIMCGILLGCWGTGLVVGAMIANSARLTTDATGMANEVARLNVFRIQPLFLSLITLAVVLGGLRFWNIVRSWR